MDEHTKEHADRRRTDMFRGSILVLCWWTIADMLGDGVAAAAFSLPVHLPGYLPFLKRTTYQRRLTLPRPLPLFFPLPSRVPPIIIYLTCRVPIPCSQPSYPAMPDTRGYSIPTLLHTRISCHPTPYLPTYPRLTHLPLCLAAAAPRTVGWTRAKARRWQHFAVLLLPHMHMRRPSPRGGTTSHFPHPFSHHHLTFCLPMGNGLARFAWRTPW